MGIEIITNKLSLDKKQKSAVTRFVNKNCSYYYFLNFIKMTSGDVKDAIALYHFDEELRLVLLKYILRLEIQMKKDFIDCVESNTKDYSFWNNKVHYKKNYLVPSKSGKSSFDIMQNEILRRMKEMNFATLGPSDNRALYSCSFGTFRSIYTGITFNNHKQFTEKYMYNDKKSFDKLNAYLCSIQFVRNRCCHSNHIVSPKVNYAIGKYALDDFGIVGFNTNLTKTINFIYRSLDNKATMKKDVLKVLNKYYPVWSKYIARHSIDANIVDDINANWL